ncbi:UNVERIFIED_CONTAM: hypothetical protein ABID98_003320 [Brevibacillus sp. OAP136]
MQESQVSHESLRFIAEQIPTYFQFHIIERGFEYYRNERIEMNEILDGTRVVATVNGNDPYRVILDLDFFMNSDCSCPYEHFCKHMAATFFFLYDQIDSANRLFGELKETMIPASERKVVITAAKQPLKPAAWLEQASLDEHSAVDEWIAYFEKQFQRLRLYESYRMIEEYALYLRSLHQASFQWNSQLRYLFELNGVLYYLSRLETYLHDKWRPAHLSYAQYMSFHSAVETCTNRLKQAISRIQADEAKLRFPTYVRTIADAFFQFPYPANERYMDWRILYQKLWWKLLNRPEWLSEERDRLNQVAPDSMDDGQKRDWLLFRLAHLDVIEGKDREAMEIFDTTSFTLKYGIVYFESFCLDEEWERLLIWLRWSLPHLSHADQEAFATTSAYWQKAAAHLPSDEEWLEAQKRLLPHSYEAYAQYLLETNRFKSWTDLHIAMANSPLSIAPGDLNKIEEYDRSLLLPLYHTAIERHIGEKNRDSYRLAIRLLKKLQALYQQLQLTDRWNRYYQHVERQTGRLRAFQEELKKGNFTT